MASDATTATPSELERRERTLVIEREFKAPPERVFRAWTDPKVLIRWWGNADFRSANPQLDLRIGGKWESVMVGPNGESHVVSGVYRAIEPPRRLAMTWAWQQTDGSRGHETLLEVTFEPSPGGTRLKLVQGPFANPKQRDGHDAGWIAGFARLEQLVLS